ncbi:unnamed protein product, partial [marine sediment metagenome]
MIDFNVTLQTRLGKLFGGIVHKIASKPFMEKIGNLVSFRIKKRTDEGRDVHGDSFDPYSDMWAENRRERGRETGRVDLNDTGNMWDGLNVESTDETTEIFF